MCVSLHVLQCVARRLGGVLVLRDKALDYQQAAHWRSGSGLTRSPLGTSALWRFGGSWVELGPVRMQLGAQRTVAFSTGKQPSPPRTRLSPLWTQPCRPRTRLSPSWTQPFPSRTRLFPSWTQPCRSRTRLSPSLTQPSQSRTRLSPSWGQSFRRGEDSLRHGPNLVRHGEDSLDHGQDSFDAASKGFRARVPAFAPAGSAVCAFFPQHRSSTHNLNHGQNSTHLERHGFPGQPIALGFRPNLEWICAAAPTS